MEYEIRLSGQQLALVGQALSEMPYRLVADLITGIDQQVRAQNRAAAERAAPAAVAPDAERSRDEAPAGPVAP